VHTCLVYVCTVHWIDQLSNFTLALYSGELWTCRDSSNSFGLTIYDDVNYCQHFISASREICPVGHSCMREIPHPPPPSTIPPSHSPTSASSTYPHSYTGHFIWRSFRSLAVEVSLLVLLTMGKHDKSGKWGESMEFGLLDAWLLPGRQPFPLTDKKCVRLWVCRPCQFLMNEKKGKC
jgi:hypothetical protein